MKQGTFSDYIMDPVNMYDMSSYALNLVIIIMFLNDYYNGEYILNTS